MYGLNVFKNCVLATVLHYLVVLALLQHTLTKLNNLFRQHI